MIIPVPDPFPEPALDPCPDPFPEPAVDPPDPFPDPVPEPLELELLAISFFNNVFLIITPIAANIINPTSTFILLYVFIFIDLIIYCFIIIYSQKKRNLSITPFVRV